MFLGESYIGSGRGVIENITNCPQKSLLTPLHTNPHPLANTPMHHPKENQILQSWEQVHARFAFIILGSTIKLPSGVVSHPEITGPNKPSWASGSLHFIPLQISVRGSLVLELWKNWYFGEKNPYGRGIKSVTKGEEVREHHAHTA